MASSMSRRLLRAVLFIGAGPYVLKASRFSGLDAWKQTKPATRTFVSTDIEFTYAVGAGVEKYRAF